MIADNYFHIIAAVWTLYFAKKITMAERDRELTYYRNLLELEQAATESVPFNPLCF